MKKLLLLATVASATSMMSCKSKHLRGDSNTAPGLTRKSGPTDPLKKGQTLPDDLPITDSTETVIPGGNKTKSPEQNTNTDPKSPTGKSRIFTFLITKLKTDALYKNCLTLQLDGKSYTLACNKDFTVQVPKQFELAAANSCYKLNFTIASYKPVDEPDCIKRIQANREFHTCEYNSVPFQSSVLGQSPRFRVLSKDTTGNIAQSVKDLDISFEDRADGDFNDYAYALTVNSGGILKYSEAQGAEYCTP